MESALCRPLAIYSQNLHFSGAGNVLLAKIKARDLLDVLRVVELGGVFDDNAPATVSA